MSSVWLIVVVFLVSQLQASFKNHEAMTLTLPLDFEIAASPSGYYQQVIDVTIPCNMMIEKIVGTGATDSFGHSVPLHTDVDDQDLTYKMVHHHVGVHLKEEEGLGIDFHDQNKVAYMFHPMETRVFPTDKYLLLKKGRKLIACGFAINRYNETVTMHVPFEITYYPLEEEELDSAITTSAVTLLDLASYPDDCPDGEKLLEIKEDIYLPPFIYRSKYVWSPNWTDQQYQNADVSIVQGFFHLHHPYKRVIIVDPRDNSVVFNVAGKAHGGKYYQIPLTSPEHSVKQSKFLMKYYVNCDQLTRHDVITLTFSITSRDPSLHNYPTSIYDPTFMNGTFRGGEARYSKDHPWQQQKKEYEEKHSRIEREDREEREERGASEEETYNSRLSITVLVVICAVLTLFVCSVVCFRCFTNRHKGFVEVTEQNFDLEDEHIEDITEENHSLIEY